MIIDILGWLMIAAAIYIVFVSFKSKQGKFDMSADEVAKALGSVEATNGKFLLVHTPPELSSIKRGVPDELRR